MDTARNKRAIEYGQMNTEDLVHVLALASLLECDVCICKIYLLEVAKSMSYLVHLCKLEV